MERITSLVGQWGVVCFFAILLLIGLWVARDYGISWDEKSMHVLGEEAFKYVFRGGHYPTHPGIRFHGAWFEILQYAAETMLGLRYAHTVYIVRHAIGYLFYWVGLLAFYGIAVRTFKKRTWALLATLFLFLSPRIFGHAFVNTRDIPAIVSFSIKMLTLIYFLDRPSIGRAALHGIASGLIVSLRIGGLFAPFYTVLFFFLLILRERTDGWRGEWRRYALLFSAYVVAFVLTTVASWPLLWEHPFANFLVAVDNMISKQQAGGGFYLGQMVSDPLPWHWIPMNIVTKTPLLFSALFLVGVAELAIVAWRKPVLFLNERRNELLFLLWFLVPILIVIVLHGHLFDEWRHVYFVYPGFLLVAVHGLRTLAAQASRMRSALYRHLAQGALVVACSVSLLGSALWMIRYHPLEYLYFSIPSRWVEGYFALDYWGLSYRQGFEWILAHDPSDLITVQVRSSPGWENLNILTRAQRRRLVVETNATAKYILDNYQQTDYRHTLPAGDEIYAVRVSGMDVLGVYRNPAWTADNERNLQRMEDYEVQERFNPDDMP